MQISAQPQSEVALGVTLTKWHMKIVCIFFLHFLSLYRQFHRWGVNHYFCISHFCTLNIEPTLTRMCIWFNMGFLSCFIKIYASKKQESEQFHCVKVLSIAWKSHIWILKCLFCFLQSITNTVEVMHSRLKSILIFTCENAFHLPASNWPFIVRN